jgi:hypothetical protein
MPSSIVAQSNGSDMAADVSLMASALLIIEAGKPGAPVERTGYRFAAGIKPAQINSADK